MKGAAPVIGVDLGGTKIAAGVVTAAGQILARARAATRAAEGPAGVIGRMVGLIAALRQQAPQATAVGVCSPGPVSARQGAVIQPPNLPGWDYVPLRAILSEQIGLPVALDHDCRAAALAEHHWGAGRGVGDMIYVTVSTGVGSGILLDGELWAGASESAGEIGHCTIDQNGPVCGCGRRGCVEAFASGTAIARRARELLDQGRQSRILELAGGQIAAVTARQVTEAALAGDALGVELLAEAGRALGIGFAILANVVNPRLIVVGGSLVKAGDLLLEPARAALRTWSVPAAAEALEVTPARLGDDVGILGAALLALRTAGS